MDLKKVKKALAHCSTDEPCWQEKYIECPYTPRMKHGEDYNCARELAKDALEVIEELEERVAIMGESRRWINTNDRMPRIGQRVFGAVYGSDIVILNEGETVIDALKRTMNDNPHTEMCVWHGDSEGWWSDGGLMIVEPRYWMPMDVPEPPEVGEDDA